MSLFAALFVLSYFVYDCDTVGQGALRLSVGGATTTDHTWFAGIVQVYWDGTWGNVCYDSEFGAAEADVICKQLGYKGVFIYDRSAVSGYGTDTSKTILKNLSCDSQYYLAITQCSFNISSAPSPGCGDKDDVVVTCQSTRIWNDDPTTGDIRLTDGSYSSEGLLEVYCNGEWGTVCGSSFTSTAATVACRQLGFNSYYDYNHLSLTGESLQKVWLDSLNSGSCSPSSSCLTSCESCPSYEDTDCTHNQDVTLECEYDAAKSKVHTINKDSCENIDVAGLTCAIIILIVACSLICCCVCILVATVLLCIYCCFGAGDVRAAARKPKITVVTSTQPTSGYQPTLAGAYSKDSSSCPLTQEYCPEDPIYPLGCPQGSTYPLKYPQDPSYSLREGEHSKVPSYPPVQQRGYPQYPSYPLEHGGYSKDFLCPPVPGGCPQDLPPKYSFN